MTNKELIELLKQMPEDAKVCIGIAELNGFMLFDFQKDDILYKDKVDSYGNATPRPPSSEENVIVIEMG
jgi:hypothetical protein